MGDLTKNFSRSEFACKCGCGKADVKKELADACQKIRDDVGVAVKVNSGERCAKHNAAVGGVKDSYHTQGKAADLSCSLGSQTLFLRIVNLCDKGLLPQVEFVQWYPKKDFVHIDIGKVRNNRFAISG